jgi:hypothetical protein
MQEVAKSNQELYELMQDSSLDLNDSEGSLFQGMLAKRPHSQDKKNGDATFGSFKRFCKDSDSIDMLQTRKHNSVFPD